jgi:DNA-binding CsgD family transcriptional regulator
MTSREIGESLVLSPRTVEGHVGNILRKLGARNRVDAVRAYRGI